MIFNKIQMDINTAVTEAFKECMAIDKSLLELIKSKHK